MNNANMSTGRDGQPPRMQMYLMSGMGSNGGDVNSGDDASVIYHEYTHGLSNRLVLDNDGNPALGAQQSSSMGEGWSDWYAMDFLVNKGYDADTAEVGDVNTAFYVAGGPGFRTAAAGLPGDGHRRSVHELQRRRRRRLHLRRLRPGRRRARGARRRRDLAPDAVGAAPAADHQVRHGGRRQARPDLHHARHGALAALPVDGRHAQRRSCRPRPSRPRRAARSPAPTTTTSCGASSRAAGWATTPPRSTATTSSRWPTSRCRPPPGAPKGTLTGKVTAVGRRPPGGRRPRRDRRPQLRPRQRPRRHHRRRRQVHALRRPQRQLSVRVRRRPRLRPRDRRERGDQRHHDAQLQHPAQLGAARRRRHRLLVLAAGPVELRLRAQRRDRRLAGHAAGGAPRPPAARGRVA